MPQVPCTGPDCEICRLGKKLRSLVLNDRAKQFVKPRPRRRKKERRSICRLID